LENYLKFWGNAQMLHVCCFYRCSDGDCAAASQSAATSVQKERRSLMFWF